MSRLPFLISIPHGGSLIPQEVSAMTMLTRGNIFEDGDAFTRDIFALHDTVNTVIETDIARAYVDMNRGPNDFHPAKRDGVIKSHTCYNRSIYIDGNLPSKKIISLLLKNYYFPYHKKIEEEINRGSLCFAFDCHSMASAAPPIALDSGTLRPAICLGNNNGESCSNEDLAALKEIFLKVFEIPPEEILLNTPFSGGYITRTYGNKPIPWIQIELNRSLYLRHPWFSENNLNVDNDSIFRLNKNLSIIFEKFHSVIS